MASDAINAAKHRVAAAEAGVAAASQALESATQIFDSAKLHMERSQKQVSSYEKELVEAKAYLKSMEEKWEVVCVDLDSDSEGDDDGSTKSKQRFTVDIPYQQGKKLGLVLKDSGSFVFLSASSIIFEFARRLLDARSSIVNESNVDRLIRYGRNQLSDLEFGNASIPFDMMNTEVLKCVLMGKIKAGDTVEKIEYTCIHDKVVMNCDCQHTAPMAKILREPQNYPISMTLTRQEKEETCARKRRRTAVSSEAWATIHEDTNGTRSTIGQGDEVDD